MLPFNPNRKRIDTINWIHHTKRIHTVSKQQESINSIDMLIWTKFQSKTILVIIKLDQNKPNRAVQLSDTLLLPFKPNRKGIDPINWIHHTKKDPHSQQETRINKFY